MKAVDDFLCFFFYFYFFMSLRLWFWIIALKCISKAKALILGKFLRISDVFDSEI